LTTKEKIKLLIAPSQYQCNRGTYIWYPLSQARFPYKASARRRSKTPESVQAVQALKLPGCIRILAYRDAVFFQ